MPGKPVPEPRQHRWNATLRTAVKAEPSAIPSIRRNKRFDINHNAETFSTLQAKGGRASRIQFPPHIPEVLHR
jgi:hypothetical protein